MLFGQELDNATGRRSGVVDQNIDPTERGVRLFDKGLGIVGLGQIRGYWYDFAVCLARNLGRRLCQLCLAPSSDCFTAPFSS